MPKKRKNSLYRKYAFTFLLVVIAVVGAFRAGIIYGSPSSSQTAIINQWAMEKNCSYFMFTDGTTIYAQNCDTGSIDYSGTDFVTVLNSVLTSLTSSGGLIHIHSGTYLIFSPVSSSDNNIVLEGEGTTTILQVSASNLAGHALAVTGSNWVIQNLQFDGNNQVPSRDDVIYFSGNNETARNLYVKNTPRSGGGGSGCGMSFSGNNNLAISNTITGIANNGICTGGNNGLGPSYNTNTIFVANTVIGSNPSTAGGCYTFSYAMNATATGNVGQGCFVGAYLTGLDVHITVVDNGFVNVNHSGIQTDSNVGHDFVYSNNRIWGVTVSQGIRTNVGNYQVTISGNDISDTGGAGIQVSGYLQQIIGNKVSGSGLAPILIDSGSSGISVISNQITGATGTGLDGISAQPNVHDVLIDDNIINGTNTLYGGVEASSSDSDFTISHNRIIDVNTAGCAAVCLLGPDNYFTITGNIFRETASNYDAIDIFSSQNFIISENQFIGSGVLGTATWDAAIYIDGTSSGSADGIISNNVFVGDSNGAVKLHVNVHNVTVTNNMIETSTYGIRIYSDSPSPDYNSIVSNTLVSVTNPVVLSGNHTIVTGNVGYNPIGTVTNFILSGGSTQPGDGNWISPQGTTSTLAASTTYTIQSAPCTITIITIGSASISLNGGTAFTPSAGESWYFYPGETISFGAFGASPPTIQVTFH